MPAPMQTFVFTGAKRQRAPNVKPHLDAKIKSILQETFIDHNWSFAQVLAHLRRVLDISLSAKQLRTRIKNFQMRKIDRANNAHPSPGLTATTGATPFTTTESAIVTPRSDIVSVHGHHPGPGPGPLVVSENVLPSNYLSSFNFNFQPHLHSASGQGQQMDISQLQWAEIQEGESQLNPKADSLVPYDKRSRTESAEHTHHAISEQPVGSTDTHRSIDIHPGPHPLDEMDVDTAMDTSSTPATGKPMDTNNNGASSGHTADTRPEVVPDSDDAMTLHESRAQSETYSASTANLVRQIERVLGPLTATTVTPHPGQSAQEPHNHTQDTLILKNSHGPDLFFTTPGSRFHALLDVTVKNRFWRPEEENVSVEELEQLERLATVFMSCGWTQDAVNCFTMVFQHWVMNDGRPGHDGQTVTPLIRMTNILIRLLQLRPADGSDERCLSRWVSHLRSKSNQLAEDHLPMCCAPEEVVAIRHLGVILCKQHNTKFFSKVCRLLGDLESTQYNQSTQLPPPPPVGGAQTPERCKAVVSELEHIVTTSTTVLETESLFTTALQDVLRWVQSQLISTPTVLNQTESDPNTSMLWYRAPSLGDLELLEQRLLVAFLCRQTWQLGKNGGPPLRSNLHKHLPLSFSQEWFSNDVPLLTFTVLSHMAKGQWEKSQPLDQHYWRERRVYAIQQLMANPARTAIRFCQVAAELEDGGFHSVLSFMGEFIAGYDSQSSTFFAHLDGRVPMTQAQYKEASFDLVRSLVRPSLDPEDPHQQGTSVLVTERFDPLLNSAPGSTFSLRSIVKRASDIGSRISRGSSYLYRHSVAGSDTHEFLGSLRRTSRGTARESYQRPPPHPSVPVMREDEVMVDSPSGAMLHS